MQSITMPKRITHLTTSRTMMRISHRYLTSGISSTVPSSLSVVVAPSRSYLSNNNNFNHNMNTPGMMTMMMKPTKMFSSYPVGQYNSHAAAATTTGTGGVTVVRYFGSGGGSRGSRGHGWWINYRAGKGGRHLQGEYSHLDVDSLHEWNDAVFSLGSTYAYIDIQMEAVSSSSSSSSTPPGGTDSDNNNKDSTVLLPIHRLKLQLATTVLPLVTENFIKLLQADPGVGYKTSTLHRVEKKVGLMGGLVWKGSVGVGGSGSETTSNNKKKGSGAAANGTAIGKCHPDMRMKTSLTSMDVEREALVLSHLPGVLTMLMPRVHEVDSRFCICTHHSPHMDGKAVAIGRLADKASVEIVQQWESSLITQRGRPTNVNLRIVDCGLLLEDHTEEGMTTVAASSSSSSSSSSKTDEATESAEEKKQAGMP